jgi:hypothetical protein
MVGRPPKEAVARRASGGNGEIRLGQKPKAVQRDGRVAVATDIRVEECPSRGMTWMDGLVARRLDDLFRDMPFVGRGSPGRERHRRVASALNRPEATPESARDGPPPSSGAPCRRSGAGRELTASP